jgi:hypothetical protein
VGHHGGDFPRPWLIQPGYSVEAKRPIAPRWSIAARMTPPDVQQFRRDVGAAATVFAPEQVIAALTEECVAPETTRDARSEGVWRG